jgi:predicted GH43/DUF377 family glycosyl hydrolase
MDPDRGTTTRTTVLVRGEDEEGRYSGVSRIGLATSADGLNFDLEPESVIFPADDRRQAWEWSGGCEDPGWSRRPMETTSARTPCDRRPAGGSPT